MKIIYYIFLLFFIVIYGNIFAFDNSVIIVEPFKIADIGTNAEYYLTVKKVDKWLTEELSSKKLYRLITGDELSKLAAGYTNDRKNPGEDVELWLGKQSGAGYVLRGTIFYYDEKIIINISMLDVSSGREKFEDGVYTYDLTGESGLKSSVEKLAERIVKEMNGEKIDIYKEESYGNDRDTDEYGNETENTKLPSVIKLITLAGLGYNYNTGFQLNVIQVFNIWFKPDWRIGIGLGSQLAKLYLDFPGYTNTTGTIFPVQVYIPVFINPEFERINDLLVSVEWAWYNPGGLSSSGTNVTTNTNVSYLLNNPVNYIDLRLNYFFSAFTSLSLGFMYNYLKGSYYFYIGGSIYLGYYKKE